MKDPSHQPSAEEYVVLREAYAETYPVRPLLNAIDAKDQRIAELEAELYGYKIAGAALIAENARLYPAHQWGQDTEYRWYQSCRCSVCAVEYEKVRQRQGDMLT
jgi:hypothetical protein